MRARLWIWKASPLVWLSPVLGILAVLVALGNASYVSPYWLDVSSKASVSVVFLAPGAAALAALEASRWRRGRTGGSSARHPVVGAAVLLAPVVVILVVVLLVAVAIIASWAGIGPGLPALGPLWLAALLTVAFALLGVTAGTLLPAVYAVPLAFAVTWLWLTFPPTITPYWWRNINGNLGTSCCSINQDLADGAILAPTLVAAAVATGSLALLLMRRRWLAALLALSLLGAAVGHGRSVMITSGPDPVTPRIGATACVAATPKVCVWPELGGHVEAAATLVGEVAQRHTRLGLAVPPLASTEAGADRWLLDLDPTDRSAWPWQISQAPLAGLPPTCLEQTNGRWPAGPAFEPVQLWLADVAGLDVTGRATPEDVAGVRRLRQLPDADQVAWYRANLAALGGCTDPATPVPAR